MTDFCKLPDRDAPQLECGYPVPCPHHPANVAPPAPKMRIPPDGAALAGPMVEGYAVVSWYDRPFPEGQADGVAIVFNLLSVGDVVLKFKSRRAVDELIAALVKERDEVFLTP